MKSINVADRSRPRPQNFYYCGRKCGEFEASPVGNPYVIGRHGTREEVIAMFKIWLWDKIKQNDPAVVQFLFNLPADAVLGCFCLNSEDVAADDWRKCHTVIIARAAQWLHECIR